MQAQSMRDKKEARWNAHKGVATKAWPQRGRRSLRAAEQPSKPSPDKKVFHVSTNLKYNWSVLYILNSITYIRPIVGLYQIYKKSKDNVSHWLFNIIYSSSKIQLCLSETNYITATIFSKRISLIADRWQFHYNRSSKYKPLSTYLHPYNGHLKHFCIGRGVCLNTIFTL